MRATNRHPLIALLIGLVLTASAEGQLRWQDKVDSWVLDRADARGGVEYLVFLESQADLTAAAELSARLEKGRFVFETLRAHAERTQAPLLETLRANSVEHRPYWVANMIWVRSDSPTLQALAERPDVARIHANPEVALEPPVLIESDGLLPPSAVEASITHTGAPSVFWANGFTGQGIVIGGQDTGYEWEHPTLQNAYRGWNGATADHNYNWHDSIHSGGGSCGADSPEPCDDHNHGTHTMGTMVGDDGGTNQIGMAPGARWIGCRNMNQGNGTPTSYSECFQWFIAPTDLNDQNPDPGMAPHVINNSWSCPPSEGCTDPNVMRTVVENTRAAGILVSVSAGNSGSGCSSVSTPAAIYEASFTVGATNNSDFIASFSSRGPVTTDGSNRLKPEISAPGVSIRSSIRNGGYAFFSGTSMSSPHVAGMAALLMSQAGCLTRDVDAIEQHLIDSALPQTTTQVCGGVPGSDIPNNTYGWGALRAAMSDACDSGYGATVAGVGTKRVTCRNLTTGGEVIIPVGGALSWDCEAEGLAASPGDLIHMNIRGAASSGAVSGTLDGLSGVVARCDNIESGQRVQFDLSGATTWDCTAEGLAADPGNRVSQTIRGTVD